MAINTWYQELYWVCPVCGSRIPDGDLHLSKIEGEENFAICPECLSESII